jgi:non-ribosomal peptide synthase protein (TIGR01720 family)
MSSIDYLNALAARGIELWTEGGKLQYKAPKEAVTPELLAELKANKAALVDLLEQFARSAGTYPLSYSQKSLWSLHRLQPQSAAYNVTYAAALADDLVVADLARCVDYLVARHPILRTRYAVEDGQPVQQVGRAPTAHLTVDRVFGADEAAIRDWIEQEANRPFDLAVAPIRLKLLVDDGPLHAGAATAAPGPRHVLLLNVHHVAADFWSLEILVRELRTLYDLARRGEPLRLAPLALQVADCVQQESERLQGDEGRALAAFWQRELAGGLPALALATDRVRPAVKTENGRVLTASLAADMGQRVRDAAKALRVTPYMLLLSVYQLFLFLHTAQERLVIGAPTAGRGMPGSEGVVGHFVNTIVLAADVAPTLAFDTLLDRTRATLLRVLDHADYPFPLLVERLRPVRDPSRSPLYQVMFNWNQRRAEDARAPEAHPLFGRTLVASSTGTRGATHDLVLNVQDAGDAWDAAWTYNTDLFDEATIAAFARQYRGLVEQVLADPRRPLAAYALADAQERRALLDTLAHRLHAAAPGSALPEAVAQRAGEAPGDVAWTVGDAPFSRDAVAAAVYVLAGRLRAAGVGPDSRVALCGLGAADRAVALLALMTAGASVLARDEGDVDAPMPPEADARLVRGTAVAAAWQPDTIRIERASRPRAPVGDRADVAAPARIEGFCGAVADALGLELGVRPEGQTPGRVVVPAGTAVNLVAAALVGGAARGAMVHVPGSPGLAELCADDPAVAARAARALEELVARDDDTPTALLLPAALTPRLPEALRTRVARLVGHGDRPHLLRSGAARSSSLRFIAGHGLAHWCGPVVFEPAEDGGWHVVEAAAAHPIALALGPTGDLAAAGQAARLHQVIDHAAPDALDAPAAGPARDGQPPDVFGALALRTVVASPFAVARRADGRLHAQEARGVSAPRRDGEVPLGAVEAILGGLPGVAEACVDHRAIDGAPALVAWIRETAPAAEDDDAAAHDDEVRARRERALHRAAKARLPEALLPDAVVIVDRLPLAEDGRIALDRLPAPRTPGDRPRAASGEVQARLVAIWREILGRTEVGVDDDFFALGGDSIQAAVIVARAAAEGLYLEPRDLFENPTIAMLAEVVGRAPRIEAEQGAVTGEFELAPAAHWFLERVTVDRSHFNQALLLGLKAAPEEALMRETLRRVAARHDVLRSRLVRRGDRWLQRFDAEDAAVPASFAIVDAHADAGGRDGSHAPRWQAAIAAAQAGLDVEHGPLWAVRWLVGPTLAESRLLVVAHHLLVDGVSWSILLQDLGDTYARLAAGASDRAALKTTAAPAWAAQWVERGRAGALEADRVYWRAFADRLDTALAERRPIALMRHWSGRDEGPRAGCGDGLCKVTLDRELTAAFRMQAHQAYGTDANDLFAAALHAGFRAWGGSTALLLDLEGHGRDALADATDLGRTVGWFTSIYPVLLEAPALEDGAGALVKHVKEQLRAVPAKGAGFGALRHVEGAADAPTRARLAALPDSPVLFTYLGALDQIAGGSPFLSGAVEPAPGIRSPRQPMTHLLDLCAYVVDGCLTIEGRHAGGEAAEDGVEALLRHVGRALEAIVRHCAGGEAGGLTPSDVPDLGLDQEGLDALMDELAALDA